MKLPGLSVSMPWPPTRAEGVRRIAEFVPHAGRTYAAQRNYDRGPSDRHNVSLLSPYVKHRVVTEAEVLTAVLARHSPAAAEKFIQEVFWRTYWKGWLQAHPAAWSRYCSAVADRLREQSAAGFPRGYEAAVHGRTGIDAFDAWAHELVETNYLHNHARMWFASIWIFTLELPWELGADFFLRHLLDGDAAANTLSWRWVAGLQTRGKTYLATRENIRRYTGDRFAEIGTLSRSAAPLHDAAIEHAALPDLACEPLVPLSTLFAIHEDDVYGDLHELPTGLRAVCALRTAATRSPLAVSPAVVAFSDDVGRDATARVAAVSDALDLGLIEATGAAEIASTLIAAATRRGAERVVVPFAPVGPVRELLDALAPHLTAAGLSYAELGRRYDAVTWPAATRGFFNLRSRIPALITELGLGAG